MQVVLALSAALLIMGLAESFVHFRRLSRIPIRIHVNGTRGKSTTTRLIAAGLRAGGLRVVAKTTGTAARLILEDGSEVEVKRRGPANIREQMWAVAQAYLRRADAVVLECMALSPETQWTSEHRLIRSGIGVITNVRPDHLDIMGPKVEDVAGALSLTIPRRGCLVTAEDRHVDALKRRASALAARVYCVSGTDVSPDELAPFPYLAFSENVACALKACELAGVPRGVALQGMWGAGPDPGVLKVFRLRLGERSVYLINAFAANDADSTARVWDRCRVMEPLAGRPAVGVLNGRNDRVLRTAELIGWAAGAGFERLALMGQFVTAFGRLLVKGGLGRDKTLDLTLCRTPRQVVEAAAGVVPGDFVLFAFGNVKGSGQRLVDYFAENGEMVL